MIPDDGRLGTCPNCGHDIRTVDELITYRRSDDSIGVFAECSSCETVDEPDELNEALEAAISYDGPALVEIPTDSDPI